jgi:hypothetical protein
MTRLSDSEINACPATAPVLIVDDGVCHTANDDAGTVALCGADITAHPWCDCLEREGRCVERQECVVCADLDVEDDDG